MGCKWKHRLSDTAKEPEIDLLSTAFGLPSRRDVRLWDRHNAQRKVHRCRVVSDESNDSWGALILNGDDDEPEESVIPTSPHRSTKKTKTVAKTSLAGKVQQRQSGSVTIKAHRKVALRKIKDAPSASDDNRPNSLKHPQPASKGAGLDSLAAGSDLAKARASTLLKTSGKQDPSSVKDRYDQVFCPDRNSQPPTVAENPQVQQFQNPYPLPHCFVPSPASQPPLPAFHTTIQLTPASSHRMAISRLEALQRKQDRAREALLKRPLDERLQHHSDNLQSQLNDLLNQMVMPKSETAQKSWTSPASQTPKAPFPTSADDNKENIVPLVDADVTAQTVSTTQGPFDATLRHRSSSLTIQHHLCSGCGTVRSPSFHKKHPINSVHKPVLNYCSLCRKQRLAKGITDHHHFCFGCGKVRSKLFQSRHQTQAGQNLMPNYCGGCTSEIHKVEGLNEASTLGIVARGSPGGDQRSETDVRDPGFDSSSTVESTTCDFSGGSISYSDMDITHGRGKKKNSDHRVRSSLPTEKISTVSASSVESRSFFPGRRLGSAQRRAQRAPTTRAVDERTDCAETPREYRAPYIEEAQSPFETTELPAQLSARSCSNSSSLHDAELGCSQLAHDSEVNSRQDNSKRGRDSKSHENRKLGSSRCSVISSAERELRCAAKGGSTKGHRVAVPDHSHEPCDLSAKPLGNDSNCVPGQADHIEYSRGVFGKSFGSRLGRHQLSGDDKRCHQSPLAKSAASPRSPTLDPPLSREEVSPGNTDCAADSFHFAPFRGAFSRHGPAVSIFDYSSSSRSNSHSQESQSDLNDQSAGYDTSDGSLDSSQQSPQTSSFSSASISDKAQAKTANQSHARSVFTDYTCSTENPYYKPRRRPFPIPADILHSSWERLARSMASAHDTYRGCGFEDRIPEPIIEEPASPPPSPVQRPKLLGA